MASAQKKVVVRTFAGALAWGYLPQSGFAHSDNIELMSISGRVTLQSISEIKTISYVKVFNVDDSIEPERIGRRFFPNRPRGDGLWMKLIFHDEDTLEGLTNFDIGFADSLIEDRGIFLTPPDARANTQRIFVPRAALRSIFVLGFVTAPSKRLPAPSPARTPSVAQTTLFDE